VDLELGGDGVGRDVGLFGQLLLGFVLETNQTGAGEEGLRGGVERGEDLVQRIGQGKLLARHAGVAFGLFDLAHFVGGTAGDQQHRERESVHAGGALRAARQPSASGFPWVSRPMATT
jgi:hypothetical protein